MSTAGDMLRLARQRLGFTQKEAAGRLGIGQPVLSRLENGASEPDEAILLKAAQAYQLPRTFFDLSDPVYGPPVSVHPMTRGKADVTTRDIDMITAELNIRLIHLRRLLDGVDFAPLSSLPVFDIEQYIGVDRIAEMVRAHWQVPPGPIRNITQLLERAGVIIGWSRFGGASVSGVTFRAPGMPPLVLVNETQPADRLRFTLAHELGHLVMHRFPTSTMEKEANGFAAHFLMPGTQIRPAFLAQKLDLARFAALKPEWKVAMQALVMRATDMGFLKPNQSRYLWQQISAKGWRLREPADLDFPLEVPSVLPRIVRSHLVDLGYSLGDLIRVLRLHESEFIQMYGPLEPPKNDRPRLRIVG